MLHTSGGVARAARGGVNGALVASGVGVGRAGGGGLQLISQTLFGGEQAHLAHIGRNQPTINQHMVFSIIIQLFAFLD